MPPALASLMPPVSGLLPPIEMRPEVGAADLGDIGQNFPDTDPRWAGADSLTLLAHVVGLVTDAGWTIGNVDTAVVCERPKLAPRRDEIRERMSSVVGAPVSIKGNRAERLGSIGRSEGIVCFATAVLYRAAEGSDG